MSFLKRIDNPSVAAFVLGGFIAFSWYAYHHAPQRQTPLYDQKKPPIIEMRGGDRMTDARDREQRMADRAFFARVDVEAAMHDHPDADPDYLSVLVGRRK